jgi:hypothetical protein
MSELSLLSPARAAEALRAAAVSARGFLGLDPLTQNDPLLMAELAKQDAQVFRADEATVVGCAPNPDRPRQFWLASTSADPEPVRALLGFLSTYQRSESYLALLAEDTDGAAAFTGCGFRPVGRLRAHRYQAGRYHDVLVYFARAEETCHA